ncbi:Aldo/keto reductase [Rhizopus microsporus var. microsporus]|uniref:Aldo/keto reductase n=2 Tax=Rhizopus microsporus TaxID=58291 RepID=A0A2G4T474_RHIZD|nr:Aldo/keto reductase [Rhizopus microsporus ATCC 52813]ORE02398.1 Aldo/keto reductase [Rhizopus microsporus var. microsporus]PHZ15812.1 Aldo/keto reductase [Rhizopus microsporus ATCC 52813]
MEYVRLGKTGMKVSRICLGAMSYGSSKWLPWVKDEEESLELIKMAYDAGINFIDTANVYSNGLSERVVGKAIKKFNLPRNRIVIATKVHFPVHEDDIAIQPFGLPLDDPRLINNGGLSRKAILQAVDDSLRRLDLDYIDLLYIHRFDEETPMEETMEALHDVVKSGKVRYLGASYMNAWRFVQMNAIAEMNGWTKFVAMQDLYNLVYREEEREMIPYLAYKGIGQVPYSPLERGRLARPLDQDTLRSSVDSSKPWSRSLTDADKEIVQRIQKVAEQRGVPMAQVSIAWLLSKPTVASPIVGISKESHLKDAVAAVSLKLTKEEIKFLEEPYVPKTTISK